MARRFLVRSSSPRTRKRSTAGDPSAAGPADGAPSGPAPAAAPGGARGRSWSSSSSSQAAAPPPILCRLARAKDKAAYAHSEGLERVAGFCRWQLPVSLVLVACLALLVKYELTTSISGHPTSAAAAAAALAAAEPDSNITIVLPARAEARAEPPPLAWLLQPLAVKPFLTDHWEKRPFHARRRGGYHDPVMRSSLADIFSLLTKQQEVHLDPQLRYPGSDNSQADCSWVKEGMLSRKSEYESVYDAYLDGCTIVCHMVAAYWRPLALFIQHLDAAYGFPLMANLYLSPRGSQGFTTHTDNKDGFIVQVAGAKRWTIHATTFPRPLRVQMTGRPWEEPVDTSGPVVFNHTISDGDLLYVPRGFPHHAASLPNSPSMHFTISPVKNLEAVEFLKHYVDLFPRGGIRRLEHFLNGTVSPAIIGEAGAPFSSWIRASMPFNYTRLFAEDTAGGGTAGGTAGGGGGAGGGRMPVLHAALHDLLDKLKRTMEMRLEEQFRARPRGQKVLDATFAALGTHPGKDSIFATILANNDIYLNYTRKLLARGANETVLARAPTSFTLLKPFRVEPFEQGARLQYAWEGGSALLRASEHVASALAHIATSGAGIDKPISAIPSNDAFERLSLLKVLERHGLVSVTSGP